MEISDELIDYLQALGRISLSDADKEKTKKDLGSILGYIDKLNELDTEGVEAMSHACERTNVFRDDEVSNQDMRDAILSNSPNSQDGAFKVPRTVE